MTEQCRFCTAAWGDLGHPCGHDEREFGVARQIAARIHEVEPTDEQVGWFLEDAETICSIVPDATPVLTAWNPKTLRMTVSGHRFWVADEGGGLDYRGPVRVTPTSEPLPSKEPEK